MKHETNLKSSSNYKYFAVVLFMMVVSLSAAQQTDIYQQNIQDSSFTKKEKRAQERSEFKHYNKRQLIYLGSIYAWLNTEVSFELSDGLLTATLGLENNLGFTKQQIFLSGAYVFRVTPRSGVYLQYYGINRARTWQNQKDFIFLRDTIPSGLQTTAHFNTQVISGGYLFSILRDPNAFLGAYFNMFIMFLRTGVKSDLGSIDLGFNLDAPLPNFGLVAVFQLAPWLNFNADVGFFSLNAKYFGGTIFDLDIGLTFRMTKWLGLSAAYQEFNVNVYFPNEHINTVVNYTFRGPSVVLRANF